VSGGAASCRRWQWRRGGARGGGKGACTREGKACGFYRRMSGARDFTSKQKREGKRGLVAAGAWDTGQQTSRAGSGADTLACNTRAGAGSKVVLGLRAAWGSWMRD
jgi:hypothetical protein